MQSRDSAQYRAFRDVLNKLVSDEKVRRVAQGCEKFLCFSNPQDPRPMANAIRMSARARQTALSDAEFDLAVAKAEARAKPLPSIQLAFAFA